VIQPNYYFIMDGRANYDVDAASVLECGSFLSDKDALDYMRENWSGHDCVLVNAENEVING